MIAPGYAVRVCKQVANKVLGVIAVLCWNGKSAKLAKRHENVNVIYFGARMLEIEELKKILDF